MDQAAASKYTIEKKRKEMKHTNSKMSISAGKCSRSNKTPTCSA
jgi:hypothetical protein